jgi:hypothetical protein
MKIGTWNVRSLFWPGALKVLHSELLNLDFDVVALQETRLGSGIQKYDICILVILISLYSFELHVLRNLLNAC